VSVLISYLISHASREQQQYQFVDTLLKLLHLYLTHRLSLLISLGHDERNLKARRRHLILSF
jgi:hypothetical protein